MRKILIVEDEEQLAAILGDYLRASGFAADWLGEGTGLSAGCGNTGLI